MPESLALDEAQALLADHLRANPPRRGLDADEMRAREALKFLLSLPVGQRMEAMGMREADLGRFDATGPYWEEVETSA